LFPFSKRFIQLKCVEVEKTSCGGSPPKKVCSRSSPSFAPWLAHEVVAFPGRVFDALRLLQGQLSSRGQQLLVRSLLWTISGSGMLS